MKVMEWFQTFLVLSVAGSLLAGILLALKKWTGKQFSPTWQYVLWVGVLLVMVVPVSVKVPACFRESACPCAAYAGKTSGADSTASSGTDYDRTAGPCGYR